MSNSPNGSRIALDPLRYLYYTSLSTMDYTPMVFVGGSDPAPLSNFGRILSISNNTDADIYVSDDGINAKWYVPANGFIVRDYCANQDGINKVAGLPIGTQLYVVTLDYPAAPTRGYVYAEVTYVETD